MNFRKITRTVGFTMLAEGLLMVLPIIVAIIYKEKSGFWFIPVSLALIAIGFPLSKVKSKSPIIAARDGFVSVGLSWMALGLFGALPFCLSGEIPSYIDSLFEIISGFTTTGSTILTAEQIDGLSMCMHFWRTFSIWCGGMGILVFVLAIMPSSGDNTLNILRAESTGPSVNKIASKMRSTASILYIIYTSMTVAIVILLLLGGMPFFDALTTAFSTAGTGGFSMRGASIATYDSYYLQGVIAVAMILFGINFSLYYLLLAGDFKSFFKNEELRTYLIAIFASILVITINIRGEFDSLYKAFHNAAFHVSSIITTTGFSTLDYSTWPEFSKTILVMLTFFGACAGSTGGGFKISRIVILTKAIFKELYTFIHPRGVKVLIIDGKKLEHETVRRTNVYLSAYIILFIASHLIISLDTGDFTTHFTAVATCINNVGPGLGAVGPSGNFGFFSPLSKIVLMLDMLLGRLEIFPILLLFFPGTWKKN